MNLQPWSSDDRVYVEELTERVMLMWLRLFLRKGKLMGTKRKGSRLKQMLNEQNLLELKENTSVKFCATADIYLKVNQRNNQLNKN